MPEKRRTRQNALDDIFALIEGHPIMQTYISTNLPEPTSMVETTDTGLQVLVELPGAAKEQVEVEVDNGVLTVSCTPRKAADQNYFEKRYGTFKKAFDIGEGYAAETITADITDGLLTIDIVRPEKESKKVKIL